MSKLVDGRNKGKINRFEPGESGNPNGRPKGSRNIATILRELLELQDRDSGGDGEALSIPVKKLIKLLSAKNEAIQLKAIQEAFDRLEGKAEENINITPTIPQVSIKFRDAD